MNNKLIIFKNYTISLVEFYVLRSRMYADRCPRCLSVERDLKK